MAQGSQLALQITLCLVAGFLDLAKDCALEQDVKLVLHSETDTLGQSLLRPLAPAVDLDASLSCRRRQRPPSRWDIEIDTVARRRQADGTREEAVADIDARG